MVFKHNDLFLPPWHGIFSTFAAIIAKRDCAIQFVFTDKLEKMIAKSKQNSQHYSTHSGCSKTLIWRPSSNILALAAFLVPVYLALASCMYMHMYVCKCMYVCMYACMCINIHIYRYQCKYIYL